MHADFWHSKWADNKIGFHQERPNKRLESHWGSLNAAAGSPVFVPLCGKSLDMRWLHRQGHPVLGIELSQKAVESFFSDNVLEYECVDRDGFRIYTGCAEAQGIELWVGDFFSLEPAHLAHCQAFYDRASLIALPPEWRERYARHLAYLMPAATRGLLLSIAYDQSRMKGPPFSVTEDEVRQLFQQGYDIERLAHYEGPERLGNLADRGLETLDERVYLMTRNSL